MKRAVEEIQGKFKQIKLENNTQMALIPYEDNEEEEEEPVYKVHMRFERPISLSEKIASSQQIVLYEPNLAIEKMEEYQRKLRERDLENSKVLMEIDEDRKIEQNSVMDMELD